MTVMAMERLPDPARTLHHDDAVELLRDAGHNVREVFKVVSAGDSGTGEEVIYFQDSDGAMLEAYVRDKDVRIHIGWWDD